jgi:hypothetical protein
VSLFDLAQKSRDLPVATRTVAPPSRPRPQTKMATLERPRAAASVQEVNSRSRRLVSLFDLAQKSRDVRRRRGFLINKHVEEH